MTLHKQADPEKMLEKLNETQSISKACLAFGIADNSLHIFLKTRGLRLTKEFYLIDNQTRQPIDVDHDRPELKEFVDALNETKNKSKACYKLGINAANLNFFLKKRNLEIRLKFGMEPIPAEERTEAK